MAAPFRFFTILLALTVSCPAWSKEGDLLIRDSEPLSPEAARAALHVPEGFSVQLFASEPMINKPINMSFDARGRLWVSSTVEYPFAAAKERWVDALGSRVKDSRDAIKVLEDTNGDGRADKVIDFADGLNIPTGVLPWHKPEHKAGCIAFSIPNIWYFADTDGDDRADLREVLFGPLGYEKDTHGMCSSFRLGPDGWVYATHGFNNTSHFRTAKLTLHSGNVFRFSPDGSQVELFTSGQVNPFGLAWDRRGNLYSADCHSNPITQLIRGAHYQSFGKPHDGLGFAPVMCEHSHGSTGLCGIVYIDGGTWGPEWEDHILVGNCVTSRINRDHVTFTGTTPKANEQPDFLVSDDPWFRPVDLQMGPDNALYVADFYNRIIGHYEVPLDHPGRDRERGRIWRIFKTDTSTRTQQKPELVVASSISDLSAADPFAVRKAAAWFAEHPEPPALPALLNALKNAEKDDLSLIHQLRIALREHLRADGAIPSLSHEARLSIIDIIKAVPTEQAAAALLELAPGELQIIAKHASAEDLERAIALGRASATPLRALNAIHSALLERGMKPPASLLSWATAEANRLLDEQPDAPEWTHHGGASPWCVQERTDANGKTLSVISSLNRSQPKPESMTGTLRSKPFVAPARFAFWICGHEGPPSAAANGRNFVRLIDETGKTIHRVRAPRTDVAQQVEWDLGSLVGSKVRFEIVDGDKGSAYAWLAVGGFDPSLLSVHRFEHSKARDDSLRSLAMMLRTTAPVALRDRLAAFLPVAPKLESAWPAAETVALLEARTSKFDPAATDATRGKAMFVQHCAVCHQIGGEGGLLGPQLDGIGQRGAARIAEDILDPWRNIDTHFQVHQITLNDGTLVSGFVRGEAGQTLIVVDAAGQEQLIAKSDIKDDAALPVSLMPPIFGQTIPETDFHHLLGWLLKR